MRLASILTLFCVFVLSGCSGAGVLNALTTERNIKVERGIAYGQHERQKYDLYRPADGSSKALVIFYYGGSWDSGDRAMYEFVGAPLARGGFTVAIPDYRLHPDVTFPTFVEDAALAFAEIKKSAAHDLPIFVMGHSAGAHIGGLLTFDGRYLARHDIEPCGTIFGFIGLSGPYNFDITDKWKPVFPPQTRDRSQVIDFAGGKHPPSLLIHGLADETVHALDTRQMTEALEKSGNKVEMSLLEGIGHVQTVASLSWPLRRIAPTLDEITEFLNEHSKLPSRCGS